MATTLKCLLAQDIAPDHTVLWLGHGIKAILPHDVIALQKFGLEIRETDDIGPYKKIIPSLQEFPHSFVATADDDVYYPPDWLRRMTSAFDPLKPSIICHRAHRVRLDPYGAPLPYGDWDLEINSPETSSLLCPTGVGGILYFPDALPPDAVNRAKFEKLSPRADDIWLYWMERLAGVSVSTLGFTKPLIFWTGSQDVGLFNSNAIGLKSNDTYVANLYKAYGLP